VVRRSGEVKNGPRGAGGSAEVLGRKRICGKGGSLCVWRREMEHGVMEVRKK